MARKSETRPTFKRAYFREWREFRGLTQAQVCERLAFMDEGHGTLPTTAASLSRLENGKQPYSQPVLEALAEIYSTAPENLTAVNPLKEGEVVDFFGAFTPQQRQRVMAIAKAVLDTGTGG
jgi:transcriptional regulator with XRE-family HTH domain